MGLMGPESLAPKQRSAAGGSVWFSTGSDPATHQLRAHVPPPTFADDQATLVSGDGVGHFLKRTGGAHGPIATTSDPAAPEGRPKTITLLQERTVTDSPRNRVHPGPGDVPVLSGSAR